LAENFIQSLSNKDIIVDDVVLFDMRNVLKYVLHSLVSGRKVILTGRPEDESLYQRFC
jgi:hypothetical protein